MEKKKLKRKKQENEKVKIEKKEKHVCRAALEEKNSNRSSKLEFQTLAFRPGVGERDTNIM